jgi:hypothetical protein
VKRLKRPSLSTLVLEFGLTCFIGGLNEKSSNK